MRRKTIILQIFLLTIAQSANCLSMFMDTLECRTDPSDSKSCTFNDVQDSSQLYRSVLIVSEPGKSSIKKINFNNAFLTHFPKELTISYTNLEDLDISNVQLWRFVKIDFASNTNIKKLNASYNKIHWLTTDMCDGMKNLETLDLSHNVIELIDQNAFNYNQNLKYLNLSYNRIGKLSHNFFTATRSVKILRLNNNRISSITGDVSNIKMDVEELYLNNNELVQFETSLVKQASYLDISENNLEGEINFAHTKLISLNIRGNSFESLTINNELKKLDASDNTERSLEISFGNNIVLTELSLSNLDIVNYEEIFKSVKKLFSLEILDLSQNNLEEFDFQSHYLPASLKKLDLKRTDLHSLMNWKSMRIFSPNLQEINILDNFLSCTELPSMLESFKKSNLTVIGLSNGNEKKFVEKNCAAETHRKRNLRLKTDERNSKGNDGKTFLLGLVIILTLGYICGAVLYLNNRFDIFKRFFKINLRSMNTSGPRSNLLADSV